ncbi:ferredoxin like protein [Trinickia symbiotica]|uniref:Ferredoxin-like protein n=1 Tax=Trinickia symbiotica TaxID=863227 RepID=A0A2N7WP64_9BURK|nr:4Fe-4S dicluster domain-containing protein [Trinickia symbiotica]PMS31193.1 ferredoxin family protein [Trinickia symbiotica]PPK41354.1 ferredoxin like protein [Trinickia symbiotica]
MSNIAVNIEEKLFQNRYRVDTGRPHVQIRNADVCTDECGEKSCTFVCPASCYRVESNGTVTLIADGCLECGSCRILCADHDNIEWEYPRGGHGILFKFG